MVPNARNIQNALAELVCEPLIGTDLRIQRPDAAAPKLDLLSNPPGSFFANCLAWGQRRISCRSWRSAFSIRLHKMTISPSIENISGGIGSGSDVTLYIAEKLTAVNNESSDSAERLGVNNGY